jgi:hypothetical protein
MSVDPTAQTPGDGTLTTPSPTVAPDTGTPQHDARDYDALDREIAEARRTFEVLNPHAARISRLVEDPRAAEVFDNSMRALEQFEADREPQVDERLKPVYEKVNRIEKFVDNYEKAERDKTEAPQREFATRYNEWQRSAPNERFFKRLMADHPDLKPRDVQYLAQVAAEADFEPLEATWKKESWRFTRPTSSSPPSSQRTDAGEVGSSAPAGAPSNGQATTVRERVVQLERQRRGQA